MRRSAVRFRAPAPIFPQVTEGASREELPIATPVANDIQTRGGNLATPAAPAQSLVSKATPGTVGRKTRPPVRMGELEKGSSAYTIEPGDQ